MRSSEVDGPLRRIEDTRDIIAGSQEDRDARIPSTSTPTYFPNLPTCRPAIAAVGLSREIGNSAALHPFAKREIAPGNLCKCELEDFVRNAVVPFWHQTCTAKMGNDPMPLVGGDLKVYGTSNRRVADGSVMPRVTTGNTMAPCVVIGERAAEMIRQDHGL